MKVRTMAISAVAALALAAPTIAQPTAAEARSLHDCTFVLVKGSQAPIRVWEDAVSATAHSKKSRHGVLYAGGADSNTKFRWKDTDMYEVAPGWAVFIDNRAWVENRGKRPIFRKIRGPIYKHYIKYVKLR